MWTEGVPAGIAAENVTLNQLVDLMKMDLMASVPLLLVDDIWPDGEVPPLNLMDGSWRKSNGERFIGAYGGLTEFAAVYFDKQAGSQS